MQTEFPVRDELVSDYFELFVNRLAYTIQSPTANRESGRCFYYRPKGRIELSKSTIRRHLEGEVTIGLYAINPHTQCCKWVAIDADYSQALEDLLKLQWELRQDGIDAALEKSRRGGHLWIFAAQPLLARDCRLYVHSLAQRLKVPVKGVLAQSGSGHSAVLGDGIEVFPRQNELQRDEFGNALRAPLGIHRATGKRYWFYGADYRLDAQLEYLMRLKKITETELTRFVSGLSIPQQLVVSGRCNAASTLNSKSPRREFSILEHLSGKRRRSGRNFFTRCPSCARRGRDKSGDNLAISISDPRKYKCWAGCSKEEIRAALGCPIPSRRGSYAQHA